MIGSTVLLFWSRGTLFYFPSTGAAAVSPAYSAGWEDVSIATRLLPVITKIASAMTTVAFSDIDTTDKDILFRQYVSDPLSVQTITAQLIKIQIRADELLATNNMFLAWSVKAVSNDGGTLRGTLVSLQRDGTEVATALTNRGDSATSTEVILQSSDRLVFEIGLGGLPIAATHTSDLRIGDAASSDLPEDDTTTTDLNPWILFQQVLIFQAAADTVLQSSSSPWLNRGQFAPLLVH